MNNLNLIFDNTHAGIGGRGMNGIPQLSMPFFIVSFTSNPFAGFIQRKNRVFLIPRFCEDDF